MSIGVEPMYESIALAALVIGFGTMLGMIFVLLSILTKEHMLAKSQRPVSYMERRPQPLLRMPARPFLDTYRTGV